MGYAAALDKSWEELKDLNPGKAVSVKFLADEYTVDYNSRQVLSLSCNVAPREHATILILHYLICKLKGLHSLNGEWISFKELEGGESYYPAFRKRAIEPLIRKYGANPGGVLTVLDRFPAKKANQADASFILEAFEGVPLLIELWQQDEEFGAEANMLFDKSIAKIFSTEDIAVLAGIVATKL